MAELILRLLGGLQVRRADASIPIFISNKVPALLTYLAVTRRAHSRDKLASLLWGEMSDTDAKNNLRQALTNLRKIVAEELTITRDSVEFSGNCSLDSAQFESDLKTAASLDPQPASEILTESFRLYCGDFLEGFHVRDAPDFEDWMLTERARLRELALQALDRITEIAMSRGDYPAALEATARLLAFDPWREQAHRQRMSALARAGQRSAALAQYQSCRRVLTKELGVEPSAETTVLYEQIRAAENASLHNLPASTTSFVGREAELAEIRVKFANAECRILTLVGEGGVGKSRLALQAAQEQIQQFLSGVWFVPLAPIKEIEGMFLAIASALRINATGGEQIREYLRDKNLLLILDNMEQLISNAMLKWISETIRTAPQLKILVTSITRLNLQAEMILGVNGLSYQDGSSPAVRLFIERARRIKPEFNPNADDWVVITRLCELVEGAPLAIELAAAWVRGLSVREIVKEIECNLDILSTSQQDLAPRHRSMRAVFDHFWNLLSPEEQVVFRIQAVFRGGFTREAFQRVTGADLSMLAQFVDKSTVRFDENGRYRRHSLMIQYATLRLREDASLLAQIRETHARFYSGFVKQLEREFFGGQPQKAISPFLDDLANIRLAWEWAVENCEASVFNDMSDSIMQAFDFAGLYHDGYELAVSATEALTALPESKSKDRQIAHGRVMGLAGAFLFRLGEYQSAIDWCNKSMLTLETTRPYIAYAHTLVYAGAASFGLGNMETVIDFWEKALEEYQAVESKWGVMIANSNLAEVIVTMGNLETAKSHAEKALSAAREMNNLEQVGVSLINLSSIALQESKFEEATLFAEEALTCHQQVGHDAHIANSLAVLAQIAFKQKDIIEARRLLEESIGILKRVGNQLYLELREQELQVVLTAGAPW